MLDNRLDNLNPTLQKLDMLDKLHNKSTKAGQLVRQKVRQQVRQIRKQIRRVVRQVR